MANPCTLRPASEYHDDCGTVLWWHVPVQEPPYVGGGPGCGDQTRDGKPTVCACLLASGWLTHWSPIPNPLNPEGATPEVAALLEAPRA